MSVAGGVPSDQRYISPFEGTRTSHLSSSLHKYNYVN